MVLAKCVKTRDGGDGGIYLQLINLCLLTFEDRSIGRETDLSFAKMLSQLQVSTILSPEKESPENIHAQFGEIEDTGVK